MRIVNFYRRILKRYPITIQSIQAGLLMGSGDLIAQFAVEKKSLNETDFKRTIRFFGIGACFVGPALCVWYAALSRYFGPSAPLTTVKKVAVDQIVFAPICLLVFLTTVNALEGKTWMEMKREVNDKYYDILTSNYKVWPLVQICNFYFTPLHHQVLVVQTVAIFWNAYLSWKTHTIKTN